MEFSEIITLISNGAVIIFLAWSYFRRKNIDDRIDKLASILSATTDLLDKTRSWEKSANEIRALEEVYERKAKAEIETKSKEELDIVKKIKMAEIDARCDLEIMEQAIKLYVPNNLKSLIHAQMLKHGNSAASRHARVFFTSESEVGEALTMLAEAEKIASKSRRQDTSKTGVSA